MILSKRRLSWNPNRGLLLVSLAQGRFFGQGSCSSRRPPLLDLHVLLCTTESLAAAGEQADVRPLIGEDLGGAAAHPG